MTMQRRHFELIAEVLRGWTIPAENMDDLPGEQETTSAAQGIAYDFAEALASTNPNFDRARFLKACGVES